MAITLSNPYAGTHLGAGWAMGASWGFIGPSHSVGPPLVIAPDLIDAFNEGVLAGQQAASEGLDVGISCVSLRQETPEGAESLMHGVHVFEALGLVKSLRHFAHFGCEALVAAFLLMIPGPPMLNAASEFSRLSNELQIQLASFNLMSGSLYFGAGIDEDVDGCELLFVPLFKNLEQARRAVTELGRPNSVIAEWKSSPFSSSGFQVIQ